MKRFECTVTREDKYIIELDENILNEEWMEEYRESISNYKTLKDHAIFLAGFQARLGDHTQIEGYGNVTRDGELPFSWDDFDKDGNSLPADQIRKPALGINIIIVDEDNYLDVDIKEIV